jgi:hypothetical protein
MMGKGTWDFRIMAEGGRRLTETMIRAFSMMVDGDTEVVVDLTIEGAMVGEVIMVMRKVLCSLYVKFRF